MFEFNSVKNGISYMEDILKELFVNYAGVAPVSVVKLTGDGSNRAYYRMVADAVSLIGAVGTSVEENRAPISGTASATIL